MIVNQLNGLPNELVFEIIQNMEIRDVIAIEQCCKELQEMICRTKIWEGFCHQYSLFPMGSNPKVYFREHTFSNLTALKQSVQKFLNSDNLVFNCHFKNKLGIFEIKKMVSEPLLEESEIKNKSQIMAYTGSVVSAYDQLQIRKHLTLVKACNFLSEIEITGSGGFGDIISKI